MPSNKQSVTDVSGTFLTMFLVRPPRLRWDYYACYRRCILDERLVFGQKFLKIRKAWWNIPICILQS